MIEYITARFPEGRIERTTGRPGAMKRAYHFIGSSRARIRVAGGQFGRWRNPKIAKEKVASRSHLMPIGEKLIVQRDDREQLSIRKVAPFAAPELDAFPQLEIAHGLLFDEFGYDVLRSGGIWYCRYVDNTRTVSKHGYRDANGAWLGAAEDLFVKTGGMALLKEVANKTVDLFRQRKIRELATVIVERDIWTPSRGWDRGGYGGSIHYHEHFDFSAGVPCIGAVSR